MFICLESEDELEGVNERDDLNKQFLFPFFLSLPPLFFFPFLDNCFFKKVFFAFSRLCFCNHALFLVPKCRWWSFFRWFSNHMLLTHVFTFFLFSWKLLNSYSLTWRHEWWSFFSFHFLVWKMWLLKKEEEVSVVDSQESGQNILIFIIWWISTQSKWLSLNFFFF